MTREEMEARDILEFTDDEGNALLLEVQDYFFYNREEYALLREAQEDADAERPEDDAAYIMAIRSYTDENGEEMEEFTLPEESLLETLIEVAKTRLVVPETED